MSSDDEEEEEKEETREEHEAACEKYGDSKTSHSKGDSSSNSNEGYDTPVVPSARGRKLAEVYESNHALQWARQILLETVDEEVLPMTTEVKAMAKEQLRKLQRPNTRGTKEQAVQLNDENVQRARDYTKHVSPNGNFDLPNLIIDGKGDPQLRGQVAAGSFPPTPFATHGMTGWNELTQASWFREWCAVGCPERQGDAIPESKRAWNGGKMSSNKVAATEAFRKRKHGNSAESRSFVGLCKILNPGGNSSRVVPQWVLDLEEDLDTADTFWR